MRVEMSLQETYFPYVAVVFFWMIPSSAAFPLHPPQVTGPSEPIRVAPGDDAILPCWLSPKWNASRMTVEWSKSGQYVLVYKGHRVDNDAMNNSYVSRTSLFLSELKVGNLSLKLVNVTFNDSGSFKCFLPMWKKSHEVQLIVDPSLLMAENINLLLDMSTRRDRWPVAIPIVIFLGFSGMICYMCVLYDKRKLMNPTCQRSSTLNQEEVC